MHVSFIMKNIFLTGIILCFTLTGFSQTRFSKTYDFDSLWEIGENIVEVEDGYVIFSTGGVQDSLWTTGVHVIKIDFNGDVIWKRSFSKPGKDIYAEWGNQHAVSPDGNIIQPCTSFFVDPDGDLALLKIDPATGDSISLINISKPDDQWMHNIIEFGNGDIIISYDNFDPPTHEMRFMKVNSAGTILWDTVYGIDPQTWNGSFYINSATQIVFSSLFQDCAPEKFFYRAIDTSGSLIDEIFNDSSMLTLYYSPFGGYFGIGEDSELQYNSYVCRLNDDFEMLWKYTSGYDTNGIGQDAYCQISFGGLVVLEDTSVVSWGYFEAADGGDYTMMLQKLDIDGNLKWQRFYNADSMVEESMVWDMIHTSDNGFLCVGSGFGEPLDENEMKSQNLWAIKLDSVGCLVPGCDSLDVSVNEMPVAVLDEIHISPNPFRQQAVVTLAGNSFSQSYSDKAELIIADLSGHVLLQQNIHFYTVDGTASRFIFDRSGLPDGLYIMQIRTEDYLSGALKFMCY